MSIESGAFGVVLARKYVIESYLVARVTFPNYLVELLSIVVCIH